MIAAVTRRKRLHSCRILRRIVSGTMLGIGITAITVLAVLAGMLLLLIWGIWSGVDWGVARLRADD